MFKKILIVLMIGCFLLGMATRAEVEEVKKEAQAKTAEGIVKDSATAESEKGYRIEVAVNSDKQAQTKEIKFVSPEGKVLKVIPYETWEQKLSFEVSPDSNYVLNKSISESSNQLNLTYLDRTGKEKWTKKFSVEGVGEEDFPSHGIELSKDGSSIVIYRNHELGYDSVQCDITVLDILGKEKVAYSFDSMIETGALQISTDGKIIGASTYKKGLGDCLFFLDVESGRTKMVKARGEGWKGYFILSSSPIPPQSGKVRLGWQPLGKEYNNIPGGGVKTKDVGFEEIPGDLSTIFEE
jgi:hypothetical protein